MSKNVIQVVEELALPIVDQYGIELVDIEFVKEGKNWFLRVYIDTESGVDIEECSKVSEQLSEQLDKVDPITYPYFLEVSSPGVERPLKKEKDFHNSIGKQVYVKTFEPIDGEKVFEGKLMAFDGQTLIVKKRVKTREIDVSIPYQKVASARLAVVF